MKISKRAAGVTPSATLAITAKANKLKSEGAKIISFSAGEPDFNTPDFILDAAREAMDKGYTKYTPSSGILPLRKAVCDKFLRDNGLKYEPSQIIISNGAKHSLFNAVQALIDDGDEVIIPAPYWLTYPELVTLSGGIPVYVDCPRKNGYKMTPEQLRSAITPRTAALILNSPSNPTGAVYSESELAALAEVLQGTSVAVISDEIYEKLFYGATPKSFAAVSDDAFARTIVVNGVSKTYAMTGWRIGYLAAPKNIAAAIDGMQSHSTSNACSIAQYAALAALTSDGEFEHGLAEIFDRRRTLLCSGVNKIKGLSCDEPSGAFYVWVSVADILGKNYGEIKLTGALAVSDAMLEEGLAVVPGEAFGAPDYIRLSYALSDGDIQTGIDNLARFVSKLK